MLLTNLCSSKMYKYIFLLFSRNILFSSGIWSQSAWNWITCMVWDKGQAFFPFFDFSNPADGAQFHKKNCPIFTVLQYLSYKWSDNKWTLWMIYFMTHCPAILIYFSVPVTLLYSTWHSICIYWIKYTHIGVCGCVYVSYTNVGSVWDQL